MTDRDQFRARRVVAVIGLTLVKAVGFFLSVLKPSEQMNAQTMLPPEPFPSRREDYRP
ncbi:hypothetical protein GCM10025760_27050 [Microbacterium yannicii]|uniref:Uncharacterized protein n=1 Tax=Microbacterium yannicii TaxID=671622 RepID=A0ABP9MGL8_9MICO|nr:hypothetical protein [Microbacterium yannicii]MCO5953510.1 hypothetical protein [Microbacterium yannicii]